MTPQADANVRYIRFANGKVWGVDDNVARTFVRIDLSQIIDGDSIQSNLEAFLDQIAEESVGDVRFTDISYTVIAHRDGELTFECFANVEEIIAHLADETSDGTDGQDRESYSDDQDRQSYSVTDSTDVDDATLADHFATLAEFFGWSQEEARHAQESIDSGDDVAAMAASECVTALANGRELRCPAFPADCEYVRITSAGYEIAYWDHQEWRDDPQGVIGALLGCAHGATS